MLASRTKNIFSYQDSIEVKSIQRYIWNKIRFVLSYNPFLLCLPILGYWRVCLFYSHLRLNMLKNPSVTLTRNGSSTAPQPSHIPLMQITLTSNECSGTDLYHFRSIHQNEDTVALHVRPSVRTNGYFSFRIPNTALQKKSCKADDEPKYIHFCISYWG